MAGNRGNRLDRILDRQEIIDCLTRMARGADRFDKELFLSGMHKDAITSAGPFVGGPEELYEWARKLQEKTYTTTLHQLLNHTIDIEGDTAHVETYYFFVGCLGAETNLLAGGRYIDRLEKRDGVWGVAMRNNYVEWTSAVPAMGSPLGEIPDLPLNGLPSRSKDDPSYQRPLVNRRNLNITGSG